MVDFSIFLISEGILMQRYKELEAVHYNAAAISTMHLNLAAQATCFRLHWHDRIEFLRIRKGSLQLNCGSDSFLVGKDEAVIIPPKAIHKATAGENGVEYDVLMFDLHAFLNGTEICHSLLPPLMDGAATTRTVTDDPQMIRCLDTVYEHRVENSFALIAHIYGLLHVLFKKHVLSLERHTPDTVIRSCVAYIEEHLSTELTVAALSERFGYTAAHFSRKFKQATGLAPMLYITILRLERAREQLKHGTAGIGEIATACGFSDANYFTRRFKKHFGVPPSHYRTKGIK